MGYLAGHALSLLGRPQDRLSHVLVNPPYDRIPEFFYPPPTPRNKAVRHDDGTEELVDLSRAEVKLANVPFLRMREVLPPPLLEQAKALSFSELVDRAQRSLDRPNVQIDTHKLRMTCGGVAVQLPEENFAFYYALTKSREEGITPRANADDAIGLYLDCYTHVLPEGKEIARQNPARPHPNVREKELRWFEFGPSGRLPIERTTDERQRKKLFDKRQTDLGEMVSRCNDSINATLGPYLAPRYRVMSVGPKGARQYLLPEDLKVELIDERNRRVI